MASIKLHVGVLIFVLLQAILLSSIHVLADDGVLLYFHFVQKKQVHYIFLHISTDTEDELIKGLNYYRMSLNLPVLQMNDDADCIADEASEELEDQPCFNSTTTIGATGGFQLPSYQDLLDRCDMTYNSTGAVLPVCVPKLAPTPLLPKYTKSPYAKYLNDSRYTGVGIASEDYWMVVVLTTSTPAENFATFGGEVGNSSTSDGVVGKFAVSGGGVGNFGIVKAVLGHCFVTLLLAVFLVVGN
ncbi:hypothetical protein RJ641_023622 [Dillenia turbinata]|uniref:Uncharacterized GPI-anchored protein At5g19230-like domain-containing protein n=1 Tax=Dillenia turbinata TaxID=194707 RepID=A0AAN8UCQ5_9MAGN